MNIGADTAVRKTRTCGNDTSASISFFIVDELTCFQTPCIIIHIVSLKNILYLEKRKTMNELLSATEYLFEKVSSGGGVVQNAAKENSRNVQIAEQSPVI